ncbi:MAG: hypothetical protein ACOYOU_07750 [Kiritimatiellia bacterium]
MAQKRGFNFSLARHYDKAIAVVVLIVLLVSLFMLARSAAESRERKRNYEEGMRRMRPLHANLGPRSTTPYESALWSLRHPQAVRIATNEVGLFTPQSRVWCVDCLYPILFAAPECPFCHAKQPKDYEPQVSGEHDSEGKGVPDAWRKKYFGHSFAMTEDLSRAEDDADGDGFRNQQEYQEGTNPRDTNDHPDQMTLLRFKELSVRKFPFVLQGANTMPDGLRPSFMMKDGDRRTLSTIKKGELIGKTGLVYSNCTKTVERLNDPKIGPYNKDCYEVQLFRTSDGKMFSLRDNDPAAAMEQEIILTLTIGDKTTEFRVCAGNQLDLGGQKYKVGVNLVVDGNPASVVLENIHTGKKTTVTIGSL